MSYTKKIDPSTSVTIQLGGQGNPSQIEGYYLGAKTTNGDYGPGKLHVFQTEKGNVGVWGKTNSNRLLTSDLVGSMVLLKFVGMSNPQKGKRPAYLYEVYHDKNNAIDTTGIDLSESPQEEVEEVDHVQDSSELLNDDETYDEVAPSRPVAPRVAAKAPSVERQAATLAKLKGLSQSAK